MPLETGTYVANLVATNPASTDPKSQGDDHLRLIKSVLLNTFAGFPGMVVVTGTEAQGTTASDYTVTVSPSPAGYTASMLAVFKATHTNTGEATVQIGALGTKPLLAVDGSALKAGDIESGGLVAVFYDGTSFYLISGNDRANRNGDSYSGTHDFTNATHRVSTKPQSDNSTNAASTAYVDAAVLAEAQARQQDTSQKAPISSPSFTGTPSAPTATPGTNTSQIATTAFVVQQAFQAALPGQTGNSGKFLTTNGLSASWVNVGQSVGEIVSIAIQTSTSTIFNHPDGSVYLKTGYIADKIDAQFAGWDTSSLEAMGLTSQAPLTGLGGTPVFGNGMFLLSDGTNVKKSTDGKNWTTISSPGVPSSVWFANGLFIAANTTNIYTSADGVAWTAKTHPTSGATIKSITFANGKYAVCLSATPWFRYSTDLTNWTNSCMFAPGQSIATNGTTMVVGCSALSSIGTAGYGYGVFAVDQNTLLPRLVIPASDSFEVAYGGGIFMAVGRTTKAVYTSPDGFTWTQKTAATAGVQGRNNATQGSNNAFGVSQLIYLNGVFTFPGNDSYAYSSPDGATWTQRTNISGGGFTFQNVNGKGVLSVSNMTMYSNDGLTWAQATVTNNYLGKYAYGAGMYVGVGTTAVGQTAAAIWSGSALTGLTSRTTAGTAHYDVIYANAMFVAVGKSGVIVTSTDGITWTQRTSNTTSDLSCVRYANGYFIAAGAAGIAVYSTDGIAWTAATYTGSAAGSGAVEIFYANGRYVIVNNNGGFLICTSASPSSFACAGGGVPAASSLPLAATDGTKVSMYMPNMAAYGAVSVSYDGTCFAQFPSPSNLANTDTSVQICNVNGSFVLLGSTTSSSSSLQYAYSSDAISWATASVAGFTASGHTDTIGWNGTQYVLSTSTPTTSGKYIATASALGGSWTVRAGASSVRIDGAPMQYGNGVFVSTNWYSPTGYTGGVGHQSSIAGDSLSNRYVKVK